MRGEGAVLAQDDSPLAVLRDGLRRIPEARRGLAVTLGLAVIATAGRVVVPYAVQQTIDDGLQGSGGADVGAVRTLVLVAALAVIVTAAAAFAMNVRLVTTAEDGLASLRVQAFRHVHDLSVLTQSSERRGSLVSRVTSDVDQLSIFLQRGGTLLLVSCGQILLATVLMLVWSWQLTLLVLGTFVPFVLALPAFQRRLSARYRRVREAVGGLLSGVSEAVVGASVLRAYGVESRTQARVDDAVEEHRDAQYRALSLAAVTFAGGEMVAALATAGVILLGVTLGIAGDVTSGEVVGFLFIVTLFTTPVQIGVEVLNEAQNALAGMRRVLDVLDTPADVVDPGPRGRDLPAGTLGAQLTDVAFAYPGGPDVLSDLTVDVPAGSRIAVVGETGSGKTTFVKLLVRLMDPREGQVAIGGVGLTEVRGASLRERVVLVPQEGFLVQGTIADNVRWGKADATEAQILDAFASLGLGDWLAGLDAGVATQVGERGEAVSAGERQLVALARAALSDPDLLVLDEATSSVDPATEVRITAALERLLVGRTSVTVAHRLSTAEAADEVLVFDDGRLVARGSHDELVDDGGVYGRLHDAWTAGTR